MGDVDTSTEAVLAHLGTEAGLAKVGQIAAALRRRNDHLAPAFQDSTDMAAADVLNAVPALVAERDEARAEVQALREAFESLPGEIATVLHEMKRATAPPGVALSMTGHGSVIVEVGGRFAASLGYAPSRRAKEAWSAVTDDGYESKVTATGPTLQAVLDKVLAAAVPEAPAAGTDGGA